MSEEEEVLPEDWSEEAQEEAMHEALYQREEYEHRVCLEAHNRLTAMLVEAQAIRDLFCFDREIHERAGDEIDDKGIRHALSWIREEVVTAERRGLLPTVDGEA